MRNEFIHKSYFIRKLLGGININNRYSEKKYSIYLMGKWKRLRLIMR
jgi:hypothetical protein